MGKLAQLLHVGMSGSIRVTLDQATYTAGDCISGSVHLTLDKPIQPATLEIRILGRERLEWRRASNHRDHHRRAHDHLNVQLTVPNACKPLSPGTFEYPFQCELPTNLPPSFAYASQRVEDMERVRIRMLYTVTATLRVKSIKTANLEDELVFTIDARGEHGKSATYYMDEAKTQETSHHGHAVSASTTRDVRFLGLLKRGTCAVNLQLPENTLTQHSIVEAHVSLDVKSLRELRCLRVILYEDVQLRGRNGSRAVCARRYPWVNHAPMSASSSSSSSLSLSSSSAPHRGPLLLRLPVTPNDLYGHGALPPTAIQSSFIGIGYHVAVECSFSWCPRVTVRVPVVVIQSVDSRPPSAYS